jgi:hypothetical protein
MPRSVPVGLLPLVGVPVLIAGFALNPGPPAGSTLPQMAAFGAAHASSILLGGWLQVTGTLLACVFALCLVVASGSAARLDGLLTVFGSALLVAIGLAEMSGYVLVTTGDSAVTDVGAHLITAVQHGYGMVGAPMVFLPLGAVILRTRILPRALGTVAVALGAVFFALGLAGVLAPIQTLVSILSSLQGLWWLAAGVAWLARRQGGAAPEAAGTAV